MNQVNIQTIILGGVELEYELRTHPRSKRANLTMYPNGRILVTIPERATDAAAIRLIKKEKVWIFKNLKKSQSISTIQLPKISEKNTRLYKKKARDFVEERVNYFNNFYTFSYNRIAIRNQRTQWGSCSSKKNLNFNYRLIFLPEDIADYVIAHELCHLLEHNHSKNFWQLVNTLIPNYKECDKRLKNYILT